MSKKLNTDIITNDLEGSAFFPQKKSPSVSPTPQPVLEEPETEIEKMIQVQNPSLIEQKTSLLAKQQTNKETNKQASKAVKKQIAKEPINSDSPITAITKQSDTSLLTTKEKTKYGTYLTAESIEKIRIRVIQTKKDDHQVIQEAINQYLEKLEK